MLPAAERWARVAAWFDELVDLPAASRSVRLAAIAAEDAAAAAEVQALLDADAREDGLLEADATAVVTSLSNDGADAAPLDGRAGPYRLLHAIGEGGMGTVFLAERSDGSYERQVAVKLIKRGMDSVAVVRRFLRERRILARLAHPNIVRLLDGGMSADGRPFYVMDYVDGPPLTVYAAQRRFDVRSRVGVLTRVADAVAYAHAQLVVHRDLKPSNVLVDTAGEPRVLDFGIAKLLDDSGDETRTGTGMRVLSPAYAAPEQILGEAIGTATDVYALGLMLCELLVGRLPQPRRATTPAQLAHEVVHETVERASALAARSTAAEIAALYGPQETSAALSRRLTGDLDVIVATALQRDPQRRYPTAAAFADDLRRWLDGRPIGARGDSGAYRLAKFVRRHRVGVAAGVAVAVSLLGGFGIALWQANVARAEARRADAERAQAQRQLARAERVKDFILTLFREQDPVSRASAQARTPAQLIRDGIAQTDAALASEPELRAQLLRDLGEIQLGLDERAAGEATLRRAWELQKTLTGDDSAASAAALAAHAEGVSAVGDVEKAGTMLRDAVTRLHAAGAGEQPRTAQAESALALIEVVRGNSAEAERLARHAVDVYRATYGENDVQVASRLAVLGKVQQEAARYADALATYHAALDIVTHSGGAEHVRTATLRTSIGDVLRLQRRYDDALEQYEAALRIERATLPAQHAILGGTLMRLGDLQRRTGLLDEADTSFAEAVAILGKTPSGHYAQALQLYANVARAQGRFDVAVERYRRSYDAFRAATGDSVYTWLTALALVDALTDAGHLAEADVLGDEAAAAIARVSKDSVYNATYSASVIGTLRHAQGRYADAVAQRRRALEGLVATYGEAHAEVAQARVALAASLAATQDAPARREAAVLVDTAIGALQRGGDEGSEPMLGEAYLERSDLRLDAGDAAGAREDIIAAMSRLQSPEHAALQRRALTLAYRLGLRR